MEVRERECRVSWRPLEQDRQEMEVMEVRWTGMLALVAQEENRHFGGRSNRRGDVGLGTGKGPG